MVASVCLAAPYGYVGLWNITARVGTTQVRDAILQRIDQMPGDGQGFATATSPGPFIVIVITLPPLIGHEGAIRFSLRAKAYRSRNQGRLFAGRRSSDIRGWIPHTVSMPPTF